MVFQIHVGRENVWLGVVYLFHMLGQLRHRDQILIE